MKQNESSFAANDWKTTEDVYHQIMAVMVNNKFFLFSFFLFFLMSHRRRSCRRRPHRRVGFLLPLLRFSFSFSVSLIDSLLLIDFFSHCLSVTYCLQFFYTRSLPFFFSLFPSSQAFYLSQSISVPSLSFRFSLSRSLFMIVDGIAAAVPWSFLSFSSPRKLKRFWLFALQQVRECKKLPSATTTTTTTTTSGRMWRKGRQRAFGQDAAALQRNDPNSNWPNVIRVSPGFDALPRNYFRSHPTT